MINKDEIINKLKNIAKKYDLDFLIVFGSFLKESFREEGELKSDIDIAYFKLKNDIKYDDLYFEIFETLNGRDIDLINLYDDNSYFLEKEIFEKGKKVYIKNKDLYFERYHQTFKNYNDWRQFDSILDRNLSKIEN
jgi:predicted nucleotidyltransferase